MSKKSRGSIKGLELHHKDKEQATQDALIRSYQDLKKAKPRAIWTKTELWRNAGLKSGMALSNPRHSNIVVLFERHNTEARDALQRGPVAASERTTTRETIKALRDKIAEATTQRDKAASLNAVYQRESMHYQQQAEDLQVLNKRLEAERDEWKAKFFASNKPHRV